jgi:hypothetical protein
LLPGCLRAGEGLLNVPLKMVQEGGESDEVTYHVRLDEFVAQRADPRQCLLGVPYSGGQPGLQQLSFGEQVVESAGEVRQTLLGCPGLP